MTNITTDQINTWLFYFVLILIGIRIVRFLLTWLLVMIEDFVHMFVPAHKHYDLWIFKKLDYIINKFWWER